MDEGLAFMKELAKIQQDSLRRTFDILMELRMFTEELENGNRETDGTEHRDRSYGSGQERGDKPD
jgi:hypothetical protein